EQTPKTAITSPSLPVADHNRGGTSARTKAHPATATLNETFLSFNQAPKAALVRRTTYAKSVGNTQRSAPAALGSSRP
ncbi:hypothetical protein KEM56_006064, partial [Ascosphaera pollenicola]